MGDAFPRIPDSVILAARPPRTAVDSQRPYAWLVEPESNAQGEVVDVATLFLTNRECPFRCLMCDLWKNTLTTSVAPGEIPEQIRWALRQLPAARAIKLYNSGNFFDAKAIPPADHAPIADLVRGFETVIVENHPNLCGRVCHQFRDQVAPAQLEIALGLETCHPEILASLNKRMTLADFDRAAGELQAGGIRLRAFLLLKPPFLDEAQGIEWTLRSVQYAFNRGVDCCSIIPTRTGNGIMERLMNDGQFSPPQGASLEAVLERGLAMGRGRVFVDLWETGPFFACDACRNARLERLRQMNLRQVILPPVSCDECRR